MATTISNTSKEMFLHIAENELIRSQQVWQYQRREDILKMVHDFGLVEEAKEMRKKF